MATLTTNFSFELPSGQDPPDIEVINRNMERIDNQLLISQNMIEDAGEFEE